MPCSLSHGDVITTHSDKPPGLALLEGMKNVPVLPLARQDFAFQRLYMPEE